MGDWAYVDLVNIIIIIIIDYKNNNNFQSLPSAGTLNINRLLKN